MRTAGEPRSTHRVETAVLKRLLVVAGLKREAALLKGGDHTIVLSGGHRPMLDDRLAAVDPAFVSAVISFGLAGALDPSLQVGAVVVADKVVSHPPPIPEKAGIHEPSAPATDWIPALTAISGEDSGPSGPEVVRSGLAAAGIPYSGGTLLGVDQPLLTAAEKAKAHSDTDAVAVDMESHVAAEWAARHDKPFAVLRVISDAAAHDLPPIVGQVMRPDGGIHAGRLVASLLRDPSQIPGLVRTGRDFGRALRVLRRVGGVLDQRRLGGLGGGLLGLDLR